MILLQLILFCGLFILMVRLSVIGGAVNALYFYPKAYQEIAYARGLADRADIRRRRARFMIPFLLVMLAALLLIVLAWDRPKDFGSAYALSLLFLEVMNWFDGIVIDRLWVGHSPLWRIRGMEGVPYVQSWAQVARKRGLLTVIFAALALIPAALSVWLR